LTTIAAFLPSETRIATLVYGTLIANNRVDTQHTPRSSR
jgi:hypothetical protein